MDFDLSEEQRMLQDSVERLLAAECGFEQRQAMVRDGGSSLPPPLGEVPSSLPPPLGEGWGGGARAQDILWAQFADLGLLALPFPEEEGGLAGGPVETFLVMQAIGRSLAPVPYLSTVVLCGGLLRACASRAQRETLIPAIASGELQLAFAHVEPQARYDLADVQATATPQGSGWLLSCEKRFVLGGDRAHRFLVSARVDGQLALFLVDGTQGGVRRRAYRIQDQTGCADLRLDGVRLEAGARLGTADALPAIEHCVDRAIAALCAEALGAMARAHELTVDYLKVRRQFGVVIGSFQALQHRAVDMLVATEQARSMALYAAMMAEDPDRAERSRAIAAAKVQVNQSGRFVAQEAVQLHGGIGMTEECQVGHYLRRLSMLELLFGDTPHHLRRVAGGVHDSRRHE